MKRNKSTEGVKRSHLEKRHKPNRKQGFREKMNVKLFMSGIW
jgi:hypothetical protein